MRFNDRQLGFPYTEYADSKSNIEALTGVLEGSIAYATDTNQLGTYNGASWDWISETPSGVLLADGTIPLTADWDAGSYKITAEQLESDVTTGTPPLIIASTTLVSNLNADMVDGYHLDQDVTISGAPIFDGTNFYDIPVGAILSTDKGIDNGDIVIIDSADVADDEYARFTANGLESRSLAEMKSDLSIKYEYTAHIEGSLATVSGVGNNIIIPRNCTLEKAIMYVEDTGDSSSTIIDINKNGTTVYTTQGNRPTVAYDSVSHLDDGDTPDVTSLSANDIITIDLDQVAPGSSGLDVVVITY